MNTAIVGMGNIGRRVAKNLVDGGQSVVVADRTLDKAKKAAADLGVRATAATVSDAIGKADVVILAVYFDAIKKLLDEFRPLMKGKIVVDPSNPVAPDGKGGFEKTIPVEQSSGQLLAGLVPGDTELVKAFGTLGADSLGSAANRSPDRAVMFYASDYPEAGAVVAKLISASGFSPVSVGGIAQSIRIEVGGDLHEFGKLGKLVSTREAEQLI